MINATPTTSLDVYIAVFTAVMEAGIKAGSTLYNTIELADKAALQAANRFKAPV